MTTMATELLPYVTVLFRIKLLITHTVLIFSSRGKRVVVINSYNAIRVYVSIISSKPDDCTSYVALITLPSYSGFDVKDTVAVSFSNDSYSSTCSRPRGCTVGVRCGAAVAPTAFTGPRVSTDDGA